MGNCLYVQYGCGWVSAPKEWRNFDSSPTLHFERIPIIGRLYTKNKTRFPSNVEYGDIIKGLPVPDNSCKCVYCSHVLEHLSLNDLRAAIMNTKNILRPGGTFRFVLPDLEYYIKEYVDNQSDSAALEFLKNTGLGIENRVRGIKGQIISWLGNSRHLWLWDYKSLELELKTAGFIEVDRTAYHDFSDPMFEKVEEKDRWENCLGIECRKPD